MERQYHTILNSIHQEVMGKSIDTNTYNILVKSLRVDRSPANIARIRENLINQKNNIERDLTSQNGRRINLVTCDDIKFDDIKINESSIKTDKKILIISIIKNAEKTMQYILNFLEEIKPSFDRVCYYFLTNNNTDQTVKILNGNIDLLGSDFFNGSFIDDFIDCKDKLAYTASLRNQCYTKARDVFGIDFDYLAIIDTNIASPINSQGFLDSFIIPVDWDIICGNRTFHQSPYHQDTLSLRLFEDDLDLSKKFVHIDKFYGQSLYWIDKLYSFVDWLKVRSAFGGIMICNKKIFKLTSLWSETPNKYDSEHVSLCTKFMNVYINPNLNHQCITNIEGILYQNPYLFIPRDAGFFSVFNYLIGSITNGYRVYPYFNKNKCLESNRFIRHFSYINDLVDNSWFNYFEPIAYYANDNTHQSNSILLYNTTQGEDAPPEFKYPIETNKLYKLESFKTWRKEVNKYYRQYIKPTNEILNRVDEIKLLFEDNNNVIGVLYRHPAHNCESSNTILFSDYFDKIDNILVDNPTSMIYLVTDTDFAVGAFINKYADKLKYDKQSGRASYDNIIKWAVARGNGHIDSLGFVNNKGYEYHNECCKNGIDQIKHGQDIICNTLVLSSCKWFVYPPSNISLAVSYINPEIEMISVIQDST